MLNRLRRHDENDAEWAGLNALTYRVVIPVITDTYADACLQSIMMPNSASGFEPESVLVVDNSRDGLLGRKYGVLYGERGLRVHRDPEGHNLGVARSWNVGAREVLANGLDYLVICSASMLFGPILHTTFTRQMVRYLAETNAHVVEASGHSWHLIAFHRKVFDLVGLFDVNFHAYIEGIDFGLRMRRAGLEGPCPGWVNVWVNALSQAVGGHVSEIACPAAPLLDYYRKKWRGDKGQEQNELPWGDKPLGYFDEPSIEELAARYGWGDRWW